MLTFAESNGQLLQIREGSDDLFDSITKIDLVKMHQGMFQVLRRDMFCRDSEDLNIFGISHQSTHPSWGAGILMVTAVQLTPQIPVTTGETISYSQRFGEYIDLPYTISPQLSRVISPILSSHSRRHHFTLTVIFLKNASRTLEYFVPSWLKAMSKGGILLA